VARPRLAAVRAADPGAAVAVVVTAAPVELIAAATSEERVVAAAPMAAVVAGAHPAHVPAGASPAAVAALPRLAVVVPRPADAVRVGGAGDADVVSAPADAAVAPASLRVAGVALTAADELVGTGTKVKGEGDGKPVHHLDEVARWAHVELHRPDSRQGADGKHAIALEVAAGGPGPGHMAADEDAIVANGKRQVGAGVGTPDDDSLHWGSR